MSTSPETKRLADQEAHPADVAATATGSKRAAADVSGNNNSPAQRSQFAARLAVLDAEYKAHMAAKRKPSSAFAGKADRFEKTPSISPSFANSNIGTLQHSAGAKRDKSASWARSTTANRPKTPSVYCDKVYDVKSSIGDDKKPVAATAFRSRSERFESESVLSHKPPPSQADVPSAFSDVLSGKKQPFPCMRSHSPRLPKTAEPVTQATYTHSILTVEHDVASTKYAGTSWRKSKVPNREPARKCINDKFYDPVPPRPMVAARAAFSSRIDRFASEKPRAPDPGTYTSKFVSCGMVA